MRRLWLFSLLVAVAGTPFACSDTDTSAGTGPNAGRPCERDADCGDDDNCTFDFCIDGFCTNNQASNGAQPNDVQTDGDCKELRCNDGTSVEENDDNDLGEDGNDNDCMIPVCTAGSSGTGPSDAGDSCAVNDNLSGACDGMGTCSCAPVSSAITVYVDAENGVDAPSNGAGRGGCAYATLDYALSQANGEIVLTDGAYDSNNATFPLTLTGNQQLRCDYDFDQDQLITTITGSGLFGATTATIVFNGTTNRVIRCIVDGGGTAAVGIAVNSAGGTDDDTFHEIRISRVTNAATGVELTATGDIIFITQSEFQGNTASGLLFTGAEKNGVLSGNSFSANPTDIICSDASPNLQGDSNGNPSCTGCENCPF